MKNFEDIGERFKQYLIYSNLGVNKAAEKLGFSGSQVSNINNGKVFGSDKLFKILNVFSDINPTWLLTGEGDMLRETTKESVSTIDEKDRYIIDLQKRHIEKLEEEIQHLKKEQKSSYTYRNVSESDQ
ncbi:MAG: XRE family transcriptional regulator [Bacteroidetes bacterium HGW-Bacteroidetes-2]|jgi:transcriptional regulator with XRE-family HTH domain|nr:MAG: XRE family transcriptional regulator [Bacteroidetes bacterium HGW-Bacteroidetes-2]